MVRQGKASSADLEAWVSLSAGSAVATGRLEWQVPSFEGLGSWPSLALG